MNLLFYNDSFISHKWLELKEMHQIDKEANYELQILM